MKNKLILSLVVLLVAVSVLAVSAQDTTTVDDAISESVSDDNVISVDENDNDVLEDNGIIMSCLRMTNQVSPKSLMLI